MNSKQPKNFGCFQQMDRDIVGKLSGDGLDRFTGSVNMQLTADKSSAADSSVVFP